MWRQIRGAGLAYGYGISNSNVKGQLFFTLFKATNPVKAFEEGKRIVISHVTGQEPWDPLQVEAAKSSLIFELIEEEKSIGDVVNSSLLQFLRGVDREHNRRLLDLVNKVTIEDMNRVGREYLARLFSDNTRTALVCNPSKVQEFAEQFEASGVQFNVLDNVDQVAALAKQTSS